MRRRWLHAALLAVVLAMLGLGAGFLWFVQVTSSFAAPDLAAEADGIVVLTGGAGRVELALRLLAQGRAERLLISGVGRAEFADLARRAGVGLSLAPRVTLGRAAASTRGNALEASEWARSFGVRTAIVVTSAYHMPRALAELSRTLPQVTLLPVAVSPGHESGLLRLRLLASEYVKFLAVEIGLSRFTAREDQTR
jgi:uncharacterized SAM-binding protein YcdF (DUF218 family)